MPAKKPIAKPVVKVSPGVMKASPATAGKSIKPVVKSGGIAKPIASSTPTVKAKLSTPAALPASRAKTTNVVAPVRSNSNHSSKKATAPAPIAPVLPKPTDFGKMVQERSIGGPTAYGRSTFAASRMPKMKTKVSTARSKAGAKKSGSKRSTPKAKSYL